VQAHLAEKIAHILGHAKTRTIMKYLGLELVNIEDSMNRYYQHQQQQYAIAPKTGQIRV